MYRILKSLVMAVILAICLGTMTTAKAQSGATSGSISGVVADQQDARIAGAVITVVNVKTNFQREVTADENGSYVAIELPPGFYEVKVAVEGFKTQTAQFELLLGTIAKINFALALASTPGEVVEVTASGSSLDTSRTESSTNQDSSRIASLPINVRDFLNFALTSARVTADRLPQQGTTSTSGLSFNGQSARLNNVTLDGSSNNENFTNGVRSSVSQEAVQEFQVVSDTFAAEFGRAVGGVVNIVTKSGTNEFRGSLFGFFRNESLAARDAFATFKPEFRQYQFGTTLGGPIKKDKAFFFGSFERLTIKENLVVTIPDSVINAATRTGFLGVKNGPLPNSVATTNVLARADFQLRPDDRLTVRYNGGFAFNGRFDTIGPFPGGLTSTTSSGVQRLEDNSINVTNLFVKSSLVNETRFLYSRRDQDVGTSDPNNPLVQLNTAQGTIAFGQNFTVPQTRLLNIFQVVDNVTVVKGKQTLKFGADFSYVEAPDKRSSLPIAAGGFGIFVPIDFAAVTGIPTAPFLDPLQAFDPSLRSPDQIQFLQVFSTLLPQLIPGFPVLPLDRLQLPIVFAQNFGDQSANIDQKLFSAFVQDDIKVKSNLLVKLGLRYDVFRQSVVPSNGGNFAPRIGISYNPDKSQRLNLHASYGIFFGGAPSLQTSLIAKVYDNNNVNRQSNIAFFPFPLSVIPFNLPGHRFPVGPSAPPGAPIFPQLIQTFQYQKDFRASYSHQATVGFEYLINNNTKLSVDYNLVRGLKLSSARFINPVVRPTGNPTTGALTGRLDPTRGFVFEFESAFDSYYNGLTFTLNRRFSNKFSALASYTFSKSLDNYNDFRTDQEAGNDPLNPGAERGFSLQDARNRFVASGNWELSYTKNPILRDFKVSVITEITSGRPFNLQAGQDLNMNFETIPQDRPRMGGVAVARNSGITPVFANVDLRVARSITFKDKYTFLGTIEFFNLFNRVNISGFNNVYPPGADGNSLLPRQDNGRFILTPDRFTNAFAPRQIQLGFKFIF
ncbi:MAG: TonB-dependent receptor [Acidobacteria bacterium]|nr:TonB-dependent receptor [Acidobacteriota bacterium]